MKRESPEHVRRGAAGEASTEIPPAMREIVESIAADEMRAMAYQAGAQERRSSSRLPLTATPA